MQRLTLGIVSTALFSMDVNRDSNEMEYTLYDLLSTLTKLFAKYGEIQVGGDPLNPPPVLARPFTSLPQLLLLQV
jgi:hypothetical protein